VVTVEAWGGAGRGRKLIGRNRVNLIVGWCGRFLFSQRIKFLIPQNLLSLLNLVQPGSVLINGHPTCFCGEGSGPSGSPLLGRVVDFALGFPISNY